MEDDLSVLSGLPWGSINMRHVVAKGHESASHQGSHQGSYQGNLNEGRRASDNRADDTQLLSPYADGYVQVLSYDNSRDSSGDDRYYVDSPYYLEFETGDLAAHQV